MSATTELRPHAGFVRRALDTPRMTLGDLAERTGTTQAALNKYREGLREMPPEVRVRLAAVLDRHALELEAVAALRRRTLEE